MKKNEIAILMATYNGERYLREQIDSIFAQTSHDWHLFVHDDGSTDGTLAILKDYATRFSEKVTLLDYQPQGGARDNFLSMMKAVDAACYMFCDQDDVWLPRKVSVTAQTFSQLELQHPGRPIVVCSDLSVVDENLKVVVPSMWEFSGICPQYIRNFDDAGATAVVTGSTMLFNREARNCCVFPATAAVMHDSWISLCTLKSGGVLYAIDQKLAYYRQHGDNCLGAGNAAAKTIGLKYRIAHFREMYKVSSAYYRMLKALGYGSVVKYVWYKLKYKLRIRRRYY